MSRFLGQRLLLLVPVLLGVSLLTFLLLELLPGDPARAILGTYATPANVARLRAELGLDAPLPLRYLHWLGSVLQGDLGRSYTLDRPVSAIIGAHLAPTALLAASALFVCIVLGLTGGLLAAVHEQSLADRMITAAALLFMSTPAFFLGLMLISWLAVGLGWFPTGDMWPLFGERDLAALAHHLALPALTLGLAATGVLCRLSRTCMLEALAQDSVRQARANGLPEWRVVYVHALRNALVTIVPVIGLQAGFVLGGAIYVETVFQWPGLGRMLVRAIAQRDVLVVQAGVMVMATGYVLITLAVDLLQALLDPRIRIR